MVAAGLAKYGRKDLALQIFEALFEAARHFAGSRLPELYCGFSHDINPRVVAYPSACSPQVWAAGAPFMCLQAVLGIEIDAPKSRVSIANPQLPRKVERLDIESLPVGESLVDLRFVRDAEGGTHLEVRRAPDHVDFSLQIG
jgi:glycogen debranching enzyme